MSTVPEQAEPLEPTARPNERVLTVRIDGVEISRTAVLGDDRGVVLELIDLRNAYWSEPGVPYVYFGTCRPGRAKGWGIHAEHDDRYMILSGEMLLVLYDARESSATHGVVQEFYLTRDGTNQVKIPAGIWHAHMNLGGSDLMFLNAPTQPFRHDRPDKWRLPLENDIIPYRFRADLLGW